MIGEEGHVCLLHAQKSAVDLGAEVAYVFECGGGTDRLSLCSDFPLVMGDDSWLSE